jgi:hypothetical protein
MKEGTWWKAVCAYPLNKLVLQFDFGILLVDLRDCVHETGLSVIAFVTLRYRHCSAERK